MKLAIMQPYLFPYIGYFQLVSAVDTFIFYDDVNYIKGGWINRNRILNQFKDNLITVPLIAASPNKLICEIEVNSKSREFQKFKLNIEHSYKKAPFFTEIMPLIDKVLSAEKTFISQLAAYSIETICSYLNLSKQFKLSSEAEYNNRNYERSERVIDICKKERADEYINAMGGQALYDKENFRKNGIQLNFLQPDLASYKQFGPTFIPGLSIIDVLMFNSTENAKQLLSMFQLV